MGFDALKACSVNGGPNVNRSCEEADLECDKNFLGSRPISRVMRVVGVPCDEQVIGSFFLFDSDSSPLIYDEGVSWVGGFANILAGFLAVDVMCR